MFLKAKSAVLRFGTYERVLMMSFSSECLKMCVLNIDGGVGTLKSAKNGLVFLSSKKRPFWHFLMKNHQKTVFIEAVVISNLMMSPLNRDCVELYLATPVCGFAKNECLQQKRFLLSLDQRLKPTVVCSSRRIIQNLRDNRNVILELH